jgi:glycosyltransferase involved in cell wall biosynthesis
LEWLLAIKKINAMKIGFYSPYYDSLSGGERYVFTLAGHWSKAHGVSIFWNDDSILKKAQERFHLDLSNVHVVPNIFHYEPLISKFFSSSQYDLIFFLSDGSIPISCASHNIIHFQVPFQKISFPFWKRINIQKIICNSKFTKDAIDPSVGSHADIIYPPVDVEKFAIGKKEKTILSVGRFSSFFQTKKQEVLIEIFSEGVKRGIFKDWRLILAGGLLPSDRHYFESLVLKSKGFLIELKPNVSFETLQKLYASATIYWHAAGFKETNPQLMEHFGITTVEAMASGCIPVVYNAGGQPEIVDHGKNGFLWNTKEECSKYTLDIIHSFKLQKELQSRAKTTSRRFSSDNFCQQFDNLLHQITKK